MSEREPENEIDKAAASVVQMLWEWLHLEPNADRENQTANLVSARLSRSMQCSLF